MSCILVATPSSFIKDEHREDGIIYQLAMERVTKNNQSVNFLKKGKREGVKPKSLHCLFSLFSSFVKKKTNLTKKKVIHITSSLPAGKIWAHMAWIYWQNSDF